MPNIEIDGVFNLRDVGGLPTADGGRIRPGRLFRSGSPDLMTEAGARRLHTELRIRTVIDLRHPDELSDAPSRGPLVEAGHVQRHHISPVPLDWAMHEYVEHLNTIHGVGQSPERYFDGLNRGAARYAQAARLLAGQESYPALIHCTAGKDRTGVLTALVLEVVGVPPEAIGEDYAASDASLHDLIAYLRRAGRALEEDDEALLARMRTPAERIVGLLELVAAEFGDARGFFRSQGLSDEELEALRAHLVD